MKAVRIHEYGGPEKLQYDDNVPLPTLGPNTVLIETAAASVNPIDWKIRSGARHKDFPQTFPAILGRDVSGIVHSVGAQVRTFKPGDRVAAFTNATYAEWVAVEEAKVTHLPEGLNLIDAAAIPLIALTGDQLVRNVTQVRKGQTVLVTGALGSVGRAAVHSAVKLGASVIAGVRRKNIDEARALGVADVLAIDDDAAIAKLGTVDAIADTVGGEVAAKVIAKLRDGGCFGYASVLPEGTAERHPQARIGRVLAQADAAKVREFADDVRDGKFILPIGRRLPLREAAEAHILGARGGVGKVILLPESSPGATR